MDSPSQFCATLARHRAEPAKPREGGLHTVLVVEDNESLLKVVLEVLSKSNFATRWARNKAEVTKELNRQPLPDLVLLDVELPDANGFSILERIRSHPALETLPVIMMTSHADASDVTRGLAAGADGYLTKPCKASAMVGAVNVVLGLETTE
jgi:DNA-binding response OmpR family regulator